MYILAQGMLAYADGTVLLAPTAHTMRRILANCESYADEVCVSFNASKFKSILCVLLKAQRM